MQFRFPRLTPTVKKLLIFLGTAFVLGSVLEVLADVPVYEWLALNLGFLAGELAWVGLLWQPVTHWMVEPAVPGSLLNLGITMLVIYFFLSPFEESFGPRRTLQLAGVGVLGGAASAIALAALLSVLGMSMRGFPPVSGAGVIAAAAFGAFPVIFRGREIMLFPLMIPLKAWTAVLIGIAFTALMSLLARNPFVFATDAAAIGAGVAFSRWIVRPRAPKKPQQKRRRSGPDLKVVRGGDDDKPRWLN